MYNGTIKRNKSGSFTVKAPNGIIATNIPSYMKAVQALGELDNKIINRKTLGMDSKLDIPARLFVSQPHGTHLH